MTAPLSLADRQRLVKLLGMLGSNFAGERDAAGQAAHRLVTAAGLTWHDLIAPPAASAPPHEPDQPYHPRQDKPGEMCPWVPLGAGCWLHRDRLNPWERDFLESLSNKSKTKRLSDRQWVVLQQIAKQLRELGIDL